MDVVVVANGARREALLAAASTSGHRAVVLPEAFRAAMDALNAADAVVADFDSDGPAAAWCVAFVLARGRLAIATATHADRVPRLVSENPSPFQRIVVADASELQAAVARNLVS